MKSLRLLVATALCAWLILPSQSLAQCSGTIAIDASLGANQTSSATGNFAVGAQTVSVNMTSWSGSGGSWAADLMVYLTAPDGSCVVWGGYSAGLPTNGCTDLGTGAGDAPWPDDWNTGFGSTFTAVIDVSQGNLSGSGEWTITILNGYNFSTNANYNIEFTIEGECLGECPDPDACNYVPEDEQTNPLPELCQYPEDLFGPGYNCDGVCISDVDGDGICDESDDCFGVYDECGNCAGTETTGCTDAMACNYDAAASCDNGGCLYLDACGDCGGNGVLGCTDNFACNFDPDATCDSGGCLTLDECGVCGGTGTLGCTDPTACNYDVANPAACDDGSCLYDDVLGVCGGDCTEDADGDGICDACDQDGYWIDVQTYAVHTEGDLAGQTTYRVYVACEAPTDFLYSVAGSNLNPFVIESTSGMWFNSDANTSWNASGMDTDAFGAFPLLEFDSFMTLGADNADQTPNPFAVWSAGADPRPEFQPGGGNNFTNGSGTMQYLGVTPGTDQVGIHPGFAGDDNRVLVMQITTAGDISGQMSITVYPNGVSSNAQTNLATFNSTSPCFNLDDCVFDADEDGICDNLDDCVGEYDECGVCNGPGAALECGCTEVPEGDCDCDGNQLDAVGVCGGDCTEDLDADGICDDVDDCVGVVDACGICDGPGAIYECGCADIPEGDCDCDGNQLDALDECGGTCAEDLDGDGICDDVDDCIGEEDADGNCNSVPGCTDAAACNYNAEANTDDGSCLELDCAGECGGTAEIDACGVCGGPGATLECGCTDLPEGACDCDGNQLDACGVCGGPGDIYSCGCFDQPEGDCDCNGNQLDALGICGGDCPSDNNENGICDTEEIGCSDPEACNFISVDLTDDGSCEYPEQYYDCDGECINDENNNDICDELDLEGCMQDFSCNFNPDATIPDTSCIYPGDDCDDNDPETVNDEVLEDCSCEGEIPAPSGIDALTQWGIEMYPSPVQDVLRIQFRGEAHGATTFTMTSMSGQTVRARTLQSDATVDVSDLASGVYFATFEGKWGKATRRVMVASGR